MNPSPPTPDVIVVGCGVSGLSCGLRLLEQQLPVTIIARDMPPQTTSDVAAAIWYPYKAEPKERALKWGQISLDEFYRLMDRPEAGVSRIELLETFDQPVPDPWWRAAVRHFERSDPETLPSGYRDGYRVEVPLIEPGIYLPYLMNRFRQLGGRIEQRAISHLSDLYGESRLIVNCAGLGSHQIADDRSVYPIRGQIIRVKAPNLERAFIDQQGFRALAYIAPRSQDCILGGTAEENDWNLEPNSKTAEEILHNCCQVEPALERAEILEHRVGLRPGRPQVRLESEPVSEQCAVIHNYGHGGAGYTLSWGCAQEVADLAMAHVSASYG